MSWLFNHTDTLGIEKQVMAEYNKHNFEYLRTEHNLIEKNGVDQMICSKASKWLKKSCASFILRRAKSIGA